MKARCFLTVLGLFAAAVGLCGCGTSFPHDSARVVFRSGASASHDQCRVIDGVLELSALPDGTPGRYESSVLASTLGVEQLAASWNADVPAGSGVWFEVRTRLDMDAAWSPWLLLGGIGDIECPAPQREAPGGLKVDVDILTSQTWFREAQLRVSAAGPGTVRVHRLDVVRSLAFSKIASGLRRERLGGDPNWNALGLPAAASLDVPFLTQKTSKPELSGRLCSPTSVAMVVQWATGAATTVEHVADAAYDKTHDIYGNWPRNVQAAWQCGVPGRLVRIGTLKDAWRLLAAGVPIVASIRAKPGELEGAPYSETDGHLVVLRGYDERGNFLVNDPAASDANKGQLVYKRRDIATVWLGNGRGTAYIFTKPGEAELLDSLGQVPHKAGAAR